MARGLSRHQIGVTEEMVLAYGERIWELSTNIQVRRGDPVRELDWDQIEAQRHGRGMADVEIADEIGLTREQVLYIRLVLERRRFRRDHYHRLYELGGGRRFRAERHVPHEHRYGFSGPAMALREALDFDPRTTGTYLRLGYWNADTVARWLDKRADEAPDAPAIVDDARTVTYAEARLSALRLANALIAMGVRRGDAVAVELGNTAQFVLGYYAVAMVGAVLYPVPRPDGPRDAEEIVSAASARAVICAPAAPDYDAPTQWLNSGLRTGYPEYVVVTTGNPPEGALSFDELIAGGATAPVDAPPVASDPAVLFPAALPDGQRGTVLHNYHTMLSNSRVIAPVYGLTAADRILSALPFASPHGIGAINLALHAGAAIVARPCDDGAALTAAIDEGAPTVLVVDAGAVEGLHGAGVLTAGRFPSVVKAAVAGGPVTTAAMAALDEALPHGAAGRLWGTAECFTVLHTPFDADASVRHGTFGTAAGSFAVRMADAAGQPADPGKEGELQVRGCSVCAGYVGERHATRERFAPDGWFRTGLGAGTDRGGNVRIAGF